MFTHDHTHSGIMGKYMYNTFICDPHKCQELHLLCCPTQWCLNPIVHKGRGGIHVSLPFLHVWCMYVTSPLLGNQNKDSWVDYPWQHIKHAHSQYWLWVICVCNNWVELNWTWTNKKTRIKQNSKLTGKIFNQPEQDSN